MGRDKKPLTRFQTLIREGGEVCSLKYLIFVYASILYNIARKSQGRSVSSYHLMNINDLGAMIVSSVV